MHNLEIICIPHNELEDCFLFGTITRPHFCKIRHEGMSDLARAGFGKRQKDIFFKTVDDGGKEIVLVPFLVRMESESAEFRFDLCGMDRIVRVQLIPDFQELSQCHQLGEPFVRALYSPAHETLLRTRKKTQFVKFLASIIQFLL